jgi:TonB family protein
LKLRLIAVWVLVASVVAPPLTFGQRSGSIEAASGGANPEEDLEFLLLARRSRSAVPQVVLAQETTLGNVRISADEVRFQRGDRTAPIEAEGSVVVVITDPDDSVVTRNANRMTAMRAEYTDEAMAERVTGTVVLEVAVGTDGAFDVLRAVEGLGYGLDESATRSLESWRIAPGQTPAVLTRIEVPFYLR